MLKLSQQMLTFARNGEWDPLAAAEKQRSAIVERFMKQEDSGQLDATEQAKKADLIRGILAADAEILALSESWIGELHGEFRSSGNEYKLKRVYGTS